MSSHNKPVELRKSRKEHRKSKSSSSSRSKSRSDRKSKSRSRSRSDRKCKCKPRKLIETFEVHCKTFNEPCGNLSPVYQFDIDDYPVTARGFMKSSVPNVPTDLFIRCDQGCKNGLGIANNPANGINADSYVQFDVTSMVVDKTIVGVEFCLEELDKKDRFEIFGSNEVGVLGTILYKSWEDEELKYQKKNKKVQVPEWGEFKFISVTLHQRHCHNKLGVLIKSICHYHRHLPAYAFIYTDERVTIPLGAPIPFDHVSIMTGFTMPDVYTLECQVKGVYKEIKTIDTLEPNACAMYINGVLWPGSWFGANATAQDVGHALIKLNVGDRIQLINHSSQGGAITLSPLGSGQNSTYGQTTAAMSIQRVD